MMLIVNSFYFSVGNFLIINYQLVYQFDGFHSLPHIMYP